MSLAVFYHHDGAGFYPPCHAHPLDAMSASRFSAHRHRRRIMYDSSSTEKNWMLSLPKTRVARINFRVVCVQRCAEQNPIVSFGGRVSGPHPRLDSYDIHSNRPPLCWLRVFAWIGSS